MKALLLAVCILAVTGCASTARSGIVSRECGKTPVQVSDLKTLGFHPRVGKIVVLRVFATWCPYCKEDLARISELFKTQEWESENVQVLLLAYANRREDASTFAQFLKDTLPAFAIPKDSLEILYIDKPYADLLPTQTASHQKLFEGWQGVPFGMVFGKDGRLAFRGHFTMSDGFQKQHYKFITQLTQENCKP